MIKFIHTADIHFGVENYGKLDPETGIHSRLLDFVRALNFCIDHAIKEKVDFFLFSGDAYKTPHPTQTQQKLLLECFLRLYNAKIPAIIVVGNHDHPLSFGKVNALDLFGQLPLDGFYVVNEPRHIALQTAHGPVNIIGIPWPTRNTVSISEKHAHKSAIEITQYISRGVAHIIENFAKNLDPKVPAVLAGHLTVSNGIFSGSEKRAIYGTDPVLLPSQLAIQPFDYVALGHLHRYQDLNPNGYPPVVYAGSIERIDFGERNEDKGFCVVTLEQKGKTSIEFIKTPQRAFIQIEAHLQPSTPHGSSKSTEDSIEIPALRPHGQSLGEVGTQTDQLIAAIKKHDIKDAVLKILYHLPAGAKDEVDLRAIQRACADAMFVVGIIPIRPAESRERRIGVATMEMDLKSLLHVYFESKPELKDKQDELIEKALMLQQESMEQVE